MNTKQYLAISGCVGGIIGSLLTTLLISPVTAQRDKFGDIECTSLRVVDAAGKARVILTTNVHESTVDDNIKVRVIGTDIGGGAVVAIGGDLIGGESKATLYNDGRGGVVSAYGKDGGMVSMSMDLINKQGGRVTVVGKDMESRVVLGIDEDGGFVDVMSKDGESRAWFGINEDGGGVAATTDKFGNVKILD